MQPIATPGPTLTLTPVPTPTLGPGTPAGSIVEVKYDNSLYLSQGGRESGEDDRLEMVNCLNKNGNVTLYGAELNSKWHEQKEVFGRYFDKLNVEVCNMTGDNCEGLQEVPAWYVEGKIYYGIKNLTDLEEITGCYVS